MPKGQTKTTGGNREVALAYKFWLARCFQNGSPEEDLFRAVCANSTNGGVTKLKSRSRRPVTKPR